ncbi:aconitase [Desulfonauticus submarinus]|uniref:Aconitate hydratase A n=1 Tax=Desulfonauticus submarinus TaxID=206665 RepID=A0A1H0D9G1_9BACT|nr:aconitate hydratase [Desulfonauticus submarinus]SDN66763.1 aconitase [Desulfonauticus submarinus]
MTLNLTKKIIQKHLVSGKLIPGEEIEIKIDQTLTQDATGTMAYLQFESIGLDKVQTDLSVSYVDHNTIQMGFRNPDDHQYLRTVAAKYGLIFSPPGTGICHQLHLENFAKPGSTLIGSDSHTPTAGGIGALAMGAGGLSVALAMAGEPYTITMPKIVRVYLTGKLKGFASAKDIILFLLKKFTVKGGVGKIFEYTGPGLKSLSVPERATITNMGAELGLTTSIFPSDENTRRFLKAMGREDDFIELGPDPNAEYDEEVEIDLSSIEPLAATPHMPDKVKPIRELAGLKVDQVAIGSCTNSSYLDLKSVALILKNKKINPETDLLIAPGSKQVLKMLLDENLLWPILNAGGRLLECACGPCIGMGGSPPSKGISVRTFNRNFEGRSGTQDAKIYLTSPITAAFAALEGKFTDPCTWEEKINFKEISLPLKTPSIKHLFIFPPENQAEVRIRRGPNIVPLKSFSPLPENLELPVLIKVGDNITTDHILPAGPQITALRSNIPAISEYIYSRVDKEFVQRAKQHKQGIIIGGENYGQGSSREHAALAPRYLGVRVVLAKSFARIHRANLINFGILPLIFVDPKDYDKIELEQILSLNLKQLSCGQKMCIQIKDFCITVTNDLTTKELNIIKEGGLLNFVRNKRK